MYLLQRLKNFYTVCRYGNVSKYTHYEACASLLKAGYIKDYTMDGWLQLHSNQWVFYNKATHYRLLRYKL